MRKENVRHIFNVRGRLNEVENTCKGKEDKEYKENKRTKLLAKKSFKATLKVKF